MKRCGQEADKNRGDDKETVMQVALMPKKTVDSNLLTGVSKLVQYGWEVIDAPGRFQMLDKEKLIVDKTYQRDIVSDRKVLQFARSWSWIACGSINVALRDGKYYVIDGQHRKEAAMRRTDITELPCMVYETKNMREEAEGFKKIQETRTNLYSYDKFKLLVVLGDASALLVESLVENSSRKLSNQTANNTISCIATLMQWAKSEPVILAEMWELLLDVCNSHPLHTRVVEGLLYLETRLRPEQSLLSTRWKNRVLKVGYDGLLESATKACAYYSKGGPKVCASGVIEALNKSQRDRLVLEV